MKKKRFAGKTALITGGCSGIGLASAVAMAGEGCDVALCDINKGAFENATAKVEGAGGRCVAIEADVTRDESIKAAFARAVEAFGHIDVLVTSAGTGEKVDIKDLTADHWNKIIALNLGGTYMACRYAVAEMRKNKNGGSIVTISSIGGLMAVYSGTAFAASKAGIIHFTKSLAVELGPENIRVGGYLLRATWGGMIKHA